MRRRKNAGGTIESGVVQLKRDCSKLLLCRFIIYPATAKKGIAAASIKAPGFCSQNEHRLRGHGVDFKWGD